VPSIRNAITKQNLPISMLRYSGILTATNGL
jgi:hypothetical protein